VWVLLVLWLAHTLNVGTTGIYQIFGINMILFMDTHAHTFHFMSKLCLYSNRATFLVLETNW
jgi:hypothetical protein